jgi:hypothetical protein
MIKHVSNERQIRYQTAWLNLAMAEFVVVGRMCLTCFHLSGKGWFGCVWAAFEFLPAYVCVVAGCCVVFVQCLGSVQNVAALKVGNPYLRIRSPGWVHVGRLAGTCLL